MSKITLSSYKQATGPTSLNRTPPYLKSKVQRFLKVAVHLYKVMEVMPTSVGTVKTELNNYFTGITLQPLFNN
jgi:hypothetical protein